MNAGNKLRVALGIGLISVFLGCFMGWYGFRSLFEYAIRKKAMLVNGTKGFASWRQPTSRTNVYLQFFMFNVTNGDDVRDNGARPILHEVGPFSFKEQSLRSNLHWTEDESILNYTEAIHYMFDEETSGVGLSPDTEIITLNLPLLLMHIKAQNSMSFSFITSGVGLESAVENVFQRVAVRDLLFDGLRSEFLANMPGFALDALCSLTGSCGTDQDIAKMKEGRFRPAKYNGSASDPLGVYTGAGDWSKFGKVYSYKGSTELSYWNSSYCNMLNGTDGKIYPPGMYHQQRIYVFNTNLCRSLYLDYEKDVEYYGIRTRRFVPPKSLLESAAINEENRCFCMPNCLKSGAINLNQCKSGKPIIASTPHFYNGDQEYVDAVVGLSPKKEFHETFVDIEPMTGLPLNGANRLQFNIPLGGFKKLPGLENLPDIILPFMYTNETAKITPEGAERFHRLVHRPLMLMQVAQWLLISLGVVLLLVAAIGLIRARSQQQEFALEKKGETMLVG